MTIVLITLAMGAALGGLAVYAALSWPGADRADRAALQEFRLRRQVVTLQAANLRLSRQCGYCGTARVPGSAL